MESFFVRFKNSLVLTIVLLAQIILLAVQVRDPDGPSQADGRKVLLVRSWVVAVVTPAERISNAIGKGIRGSWTNYIDLRDTRQQNQQLKQEIARLRLEQSEFSEDAAQGLRLQQLLAFREHYVTATVAAQVIGTSGEDQSRVLYIDKGSADGLKPDMAVITPDGIVGKIRDVFPGTSPHTAQVLEINDPASGAGVILASTRIRAILRGALGGGIQIGNLTQDSRIKPGEAVLTSGGDQIFPRGLKVGTIESIEPDPDHQPYTRIRIKPAANLTQLEEVLIITGTQSDLPAAGAAGSRRRRRHRRAGQTRRRGRRRASAQPEPRSECSRRNRGQSCRRRVRGAGRRSEAPSDAASGSLHAGNNASCGGSHAWRCESVSERDDASAEPARPRANLSRIPNTETAPKRAPKPKQQPASQDANPPQAKEPQP